MSVSSIPSIIWTAMNSIRPSTAIGMRSPNKSKLKVAMPNTTGKSSYNEYLIVQIEMKAEKERMKIERQQLKSSKLNISLNEPGLRRVRQRPGSAHVGTRRSQETTNSNARRRKRLQRLIQLSSGQIQQHSQQATGESPPAPSSIENYNNSVLQVPSVTMQRTPHTHTFTSSYGGSHGRGVTVSDLRKQFRAVRAYAMSGPDARRIKTHGIDPKRDVPQLASYYSTVQVEGIPLPMGVPQLGLYDNGGNSRHHAEELYARETNGNNISTNNHSHSHNTNTNTNTNMATSSPVGISPWDDDGNLTPGRGPSLSPTRYQQPPSQSSSPFSPEQTERSPSLQRHPFGNFETNTTTGTGTGTTTETNPATQILSPRSRARKSKSKQKVSGPRINPHRKLTNVGKTSSYDQLIDIETKSHQPTHFKMGLNGKSAQTFVRRPRPSTAGFNRSRNIEGGKKINTAIEMGETKIRETTLNKNIHQMMNKSKARNNTSSTSSTSSPTVKRAPRPMSASIARKMGSKRHGFESTNGKFSLSATNNKNNYNSNHNNSNNYSTNEKKRNALKKKGSAIMFNLKKTGFRNEITAIRGNGRLRGSSLKSKGKKSKRQPIDMESEMTLIQTATGSISNGLLRQTQRTRPSTAGGHRSRRNRMNQTR